METPGSRSGKAPAAPAAAGDGLPSARLSAAPSLELSSGAVFRREGEYWTIAYDGVVFRLRETKGLPCIAYLLRHPGVTVSAVDLLVAGQRGTPRTLEPSTSRLLPPDPEHARMTVTKRIRGAITKIGVQHASLGHHLSTCIKTGSLCAYRPDPARPIAWTL